MNSILSASSKLRPRSTLLLRFGRSSSIYKDAHGAVVDLKFNYKEGKVPIACLFVWEGWRGTPVNNWKCTRFTDMQEMTRDIYNYYRIKEQQALGLRPKY